VSNFLLLTLKRQALWLEIRIVCWKFKKFAEFSGDFWLRAVALAFAAAHERGQETL
jgi:hypothetical protein